MIRHLWNEEWKNIQFDEVISVKLKFKISNYGRVINCSGEKEYLKNRTFINGYETISLKQEINKKSTSRYVHKLVAQHFIEKENENQIYVIHLNYDKDDNTVENLQWATKREKELHQFNNPTWEAIFKNKSIEYAKLSVGKVKIIKRQLKNKRTRISMIAKRFGVSDTQIHRIKSGENWSHVKI
ncbi:MULTISPECIES: NUMOD4 domain-containing protein [unclassified Polaribacter]|uniref:NUMOD4 domain-containing protein n=1 Tax=unclassified Polaribacter TaxID=196858 RepID=UPI0011BE35DF|nr:MULTISPECIES: NUMOD4 domain-containing protein [unclassified Polaribacter]TXD51510.1 HNH endonuclease [Polaribacter sp. IC063]TXD58113.1 HNH endonuclease [Polaribacter sp. IC066]